MKSRLEFEQEGTSQKWRIRPEGESRAIAHGGAQCEYGSATSSTLR